MQRITLASITAEENYILKKKLEVLAAELGPLQFNSVRPQGLIATLESHAQLVILNTTHSVRAHIPQLLSLRAKGYDQALLVIAKPETTDPLQALQMLKGTVLLERPYDTKNLRGIVKKFLKADPVAQQVHRRYSTSVSTDVESIDGNFKIKSTLFNLSKGGACLQFAQLAPLRTGDKLKVKIELNQMNRKYDMIARIVWISPDGPPGGVGIEFTGPAIIHRSVIGAF